MISHLSHLSQRTEWEERKLLRWFIKHILFPSWPFVLRGRTLKLGPISKSYYQVMDYLIYPLSFHHRIVVFISEELLSELISFLSLFHANSRGLYRLHYEMRGLCPFGSSLHQILWGSISQRRNYNQQSTFACTSQQRWYVDDNERIGSQIGRYIRGLQTKGSSVSEFYKLIWVY